MPFDQLLDENNKPIINYQSCISEGTQFFRYFGLLYLLNIQNKLFCVPMSGETIKTLNNNQSYFLRWISTNNELLHDKIFDKNLKKCLLQTESRFIVISLSLKGRQDHANYIIIDNKLDDNNKKTAIRIEPLGFGNTPCYYNPTELDTQILKYLKTLDNDNITLVGNEATISNIGPQSIECSERREYNHDQIFPNQGLCATFSFLIIYTFFHLYLKTEDKDTDAGTKLFENILGQMNFNFIYSAYPGWVEELGVSMNQKILDGIYPIFVQLLEIYSINRIETRNNKSDAKINNILKHYNIDKELDPSMRSIIQQGMYDTIIHIINNSRLDNDTKNEIFTIYGINFDNLLNHVKIKDTIQLISKSPSPSSPPSKRQRKAKGAKKTRKKLRKRYTRKKKYKKKNHKK
jgi:hypothetical protein